MALEDNAAKTLILRFVKLHEVVFCYNFPISQKPRQFRIMYHQKCLHPFHSDLKKSRLLFQQLLLHKVFQLILYGRAEIRRIYL